MRRFHLHFLTPPSSILMLLILLVFHGAPARAGVCFNGTDGKRAAYLDSSGDLYLRGNLTPGKTITSFDPDKKAWRILNNLNQPLIILALESQNISITVDPYIMPLNTGDMVIRGSRLAYSGTPNVYKLLDDGGIGYFGIDSSGNMYLKNLDTGNYAGKIHEQTTTVEINSARILTPPFCNNEQEALYSMNRGFVYNYKNEKDLDPLTLSSNPSPTDTFSYMNSFFGDGDSWPSTWAGNDAQGKPFIIFSNTDGSGLAYRTQWDPPSEETHLPPWGTHKYSLYNWPYIGETALNGGSVVRINGFYMPNMAISTFTGYPSNQCSTMEMLTTTEPPAQEPPRDAIAQNSKGHTIARFLDKSQWPDQVDGIPIDYDHPVGDQDLDEFHQKKFFIDKNRNAYILSSMVHQSGLICIKDKPGARTLYMAVNIVEGSHPGPDGKRGPRANHPLNGCFILKSGEDAQHPLGAKWGPVTDEGTANTLPLIDISYYNGDSQTPPVSTFQNAVVWPPENPKNNFSLPVFIQFGNEYADYKLAPLEENETANPIWDREINHPSDPGGYYVYAIAAEERYLFTSRLWLGRVRMRHGHPDDIWRDVESQSGWQYQPWEYWAGTDQDGKQIWVANRANATEILYSYNELAWPTVMYHAPSNRFLMTTFTASDKGEWDGVSENGIGWERYPKDPGGGRFDCRWFLWEAPYPWGPWKKIFTNDYNGRQNDIPEIKREYETTDVSNNHWLRGFCGYTVNLMPTWTESDPNGGWNIWVMQAGFEKNFAPWYSITMTFPDNDWSGATLYSPQFYKIHINPEAAPFSGYESAMNNYQQNCSRRNATVKVGVQFKVPMGNQITVTHLGRYCATGDKSDTHHINLYEVPTPTPTPPPPPTPTPTVTPTPIPRSAAGTMLRSVNLNLTNAANKMDEHSFRYAATTSSITLGSTSVDKCYLLESEEIASGDPFYGYYNNDDTNTNRDYSMTELRGGHVVQFMNGLESTDGITWGVYNDKYKTVYNSGYTVPRYNSPGTHPGNSIGLINFLYTISSSPITFDSWSWGAYGEVSPEINAWIGCKFNLEKDLVITHLGRRFISGNNKKHEIRLIHKEPEIPIRNEKTLGSTDQVLPAFYRPLRYVTVATAVVDMTQSAENNFVYARLKTPVWITPMIRVRPPEDPVSYPDETGDVSAPEFYLVCREYQGGDDYMGSYDPNHPEYNSSFAVPNAVDEAFGGVITAALLSKTGFLNGPNFEK